MHVGRCSRPVVAFAWCSLLKLPLLLLFSHTYKLNLPPYITYIQCNTHIPRRVVLMTS